MKNSVIGKYLIVYMFLVSLPYIALSADIILKNNSGVKWILKQNENGYSFGSITLNDILIEPALDDGLFRFVNTTNDSSFWMIASKGKKISGSKAVLSGKGNIDGAEVKYKVTVETPDDVKAVRIIYDFEVNKDIKNRQAVLQFNSKFDNSWKCHMYPFVEDSKWIARDTLSWMGIPSLFMYRTDRSMGMLWGIDPNSDYLNPTTWTKNFGLYFTDRLVPAQYRVGGKGLKKSINYHCPMQLVLTDESDPDELIIDLVDDWMKLNDYKVLPIYVRSNDEALDLFIKGRRTNPGGYIKGKGYGLHGWRHLDDFMYMGVQGMAAYFDYILFEMTGDSLWRTRAFEQMDFVREGQEWNKSSLNYGAQHTSYVLSQEYQDDYGPNAPGWNSDDRWNIGYKPDISALCAQYMLKLWKRVKDHEGVNREDWYESATNLVEFIMRQQNEDGGLAQKVQIEPLEYRWHAPWRNLVVTPIKYRSSTAGRALPAFGDIYKITGDERHKDFMKELEEYHLKAVQNNYFFTGHHPDLPPYALTEASIWGVCEYWLDQYEVTGKPEYLKHAKANIALAMTWWVPKQLSWIDNPTQGGAAEQQHYLSLTMYCYQNRKVECIKRLYDFTKDPFYNEIYNMVVQTNYWTQKTRGEGIGGIHERTSVPWYPEEAWLDGDYYNDLGSYYFNEQALDLFVQIMEMYRSSVDRAYLGDNLTTKIFPDGVCYYSRDIGGLKEVPFSVIPSSGSIKYKIGDWSINGRSWTVSEGPNSEISLSVSMGGFNDFIWFDVLRDGKKIAEYQSNYRGEFYFTITGQFTDESELKIVERNN